VQRLGFLWWLLDHFLSVTLVPHIQKMPHLKQELDQDLY
jgi:hypothetical protein